jgi:hypothetical protein
LQILFFQWNNVGVAKNKIRQNVAVGLVGFSLLLSSCGSGGRGAADDAVIPSNFAGYVYPGGLFSLSMPPDWVVNDISDGSAVHVEFSPPDSAFPQLIIFVVRMEEETTDFDSAVGDFTRLFYNDDSAPYKEVSREPQPDGSLRLIGVVETPGYSTQHNDFLQQFGPYFVALRAVLPADPTGLRALNRVLNTFQLDAEVPWVRSTQGLDAVVGQGAVGFSSLHAWVDSGETFSISGQILNNATAPLEFVRVTAQLYDVNNTVISEQGDFIAADVVEPGEFSPFQVLFLDGLPSETARYEVHATARYADFAAETFYGPSNFVVVDNADFDANGLLVISGQVTNNGGQRASLVKVIVTVFDPGQRVIGTDTTLVEAQSLAPGETSTFRVQFTELGGVADTYLSTAQASLVP